jgi:hypothetical protein
VRDPLSGDLDRLGDRLTAAVARRLERRRVSERRRRLAIAAVASAVGISALTPAPLGPAKRNLAVASNSVALLRCDLPRGTRFALPACDGTVRRGLKGLRRTAGP